MKGFGAVHFNPEISGVDGAEVGVEKTREGMIRYDWRKSRWKSGFYRNSEAAL